MSEQLFDERYARRMAQLWVDLCVNPNIDNGDLSAHGPLSRQLMKMTVVRAAPDTLAEYEQAIVNTLLEHTDRRDLRLSCDYSPNETLVRAMESIGKTERDFDNPIKTSVNFWANDTPVIDVKAGYAAPSMLHYALPDGRWMKVARGEMESKMVEYAIGGFPEFDIYEAPPVRTAESTKSRTSD